METIKQGGCYRCKDKESWLLVLKRHSNGIYSTRRVWITEDFYDEEIRDLEADKIREIADLSICYRPYYRKRKGLYAVWDETKPSDKKIILQEPSHSR